VLRIALPVYGIVALFAVGYAAFSEHLSTLLGEGSPELKELAAAAGFALVLVALTRVGARAWAPLARAARAGAEVLGPISVWEALALAGLSGVAEELLFRGALWLPLGLWGSTLLFGLLHVVLKRGLWVYPLFALVAGLLMGLLRQGSEHVLPCMLAHFVVNAFNLVWLSRIARGTTAPPTAVVPPAATPPAPGPADPSPGPVPRADTDPPA
jgi:hypothetical protein